MARAKAKGVSHKPERPSAAGAEYDSWGERIAFWCLLAAIVLVPLIIARTGWFTGQPRSLLSDQFELPKVMLLRVLTLASLCAWLWHVASTAAPGGGPPPTTSCSRCSDGCS